MTVLTMAISYREEVAVLETAEMWNSYPSILILFLRVAWRQASLRGESEFGHTIGVHLLRIRAIE